MHLVIVSIARIDTGMVEESAHDGDVANRRGGLTLRRTPGEHELQGAPINNTGQTTNVLRQGARTIAAWSS